MTPQPRRDTGPIRCAYPAEPTQRPHCQLTAVITSGAVAWCTDCHARRSTLGKAITPHRLPPQPTLDVLVWITQADTRLHQAHAELAAAVTRARAQQHPWSAIAAQLKITRQAAQQRFKQDQPVGG